MLVKELKAILETVEDDTEITDSSLHECFCAEASYCCSDCRDIHTCGPDSDLDADYFVFWFENLGPKKSAPINVMRDKLTTITAERDRYRDALRAIPYDEHWGPGSERLGLVCPACLKYTPVDEQWNHAPDCAKAEAKAQS